MSAVLFATVTNHQCGSCGVVYGLEEGFEQKRRQDHATFYCPNGHQRAFRGKTGQEQEIDRLQQEVRQLANSRDYHRDYGERKSREAETAKRSAAASRGVVTKVKKRLGKGACPCCNRYFRDLHQHMQGQHPDWSKADDA